MRERLLGWSLRVPALEASVAEAAGAVTAVDAQPAAPSPPALDATIRVVQADGQGVPRVQPSPPTPPGRWGQGEKRGKQPAAVVTGRSPIAPDRRTPQEVGAALWPEAGCSQTSARPRPVATARHATRAGTAVAMTRWVQRVSPRAGTQRQHRVALTAGAASVPHQLVRHLPAYTHGLASRHATASLWDTAHVWLGATHPHRTAVGAQLAGARAGWPEGGGEHRPARGGPRSRWHGDPTARRPAPDRRLPAPPPGEALR